MTATDSSSPHGNNLHDQLVPYLDGELDPQTSRQVEDWIANDPAAREELRRLEQTWLLLDELPRNKTDDSFVQTTVEMITVSADGRPRHAGMWRDRLSRGWLSGVGVVLAVMAGFLTVSASVPNPNRQLLEDLPLLENLDAYRQVDDLDFLRALKKSGLFDAEEANHGT